MNKIKGTFLGLAAMLTVGFLAQPALADMADKAVGNWKAHNGSVVRLSKSGSRLVGTVVSVKDNSRRDKHNPDASKRSRKLPGIRILSLKKKSANSWSGTGYNTESGGNYTGTLTVLSGSKIKLQGCKFVVACKTFQWSRK